MKYDEMLDAMISMDESQRSSAIKEHWQAVFSDGFVAYVQGQIEAGQNMEGWASSLGSGLMADALNQLTRERTRGIQSLRESMRSVFAEMQCASERQGNSGGMVGHSPHRAMPTGHNIPPAVGCYRCGSQVTSQGLCAACFNSQREWQEADLEHDRLLADIERQRIESDQRYYDNQADYNTYTDYGSSDIPDYSSDY